jgi:hypothetical protein
MLPRKLESAQRVRRRFRLSLPKCRKPKRWRTLKRSRKPKRFHGGDEMTTTIARGGAALTKKMSTIVRGGASVLATTMMKIATEDGMTMMIRARTIMGMSRARPVNKKQESISGSFGR